MDARLKTFASEAVRHFDYLRTDFHFMGPEVSRTSVGYFRYPLSVVVSFDPRDQTVDTDLRLSYADDQTRVDLRQVVVAAGLGPAQRAPFSAPTRHAMVKSLTKQAAVLREAMPLLLADDGLALLHQAKSMRV